MFYYNFGRIQQTNKKAIVDLVLHFSLGSTKMTLDFRLENVASGRVDNNIDFAMRMHAVFGKHRDLPCLFRLFNVHIIFVLTVKRFFFFYSFATPGVR